MDRKQILTEEVAKRFAQIVEYTIPGGRGLAEADDDNQQDPNAQGGAPDMGGDPNAMGGDPNAMGGDPNAMGGDPNAMGGDPNAMGGDPNAMGGDPNAMGGEQTPQGLNPQDGGDPSMMGEDPSMMGEDPNAPQPDDDVVDITDLTDSQDKTEEEVEKLGGKFSEILGAIKSLEHSIKMNDDKIADLRADFEKRNPTQIEKLGMQTARSYPFNITVDDYWKDKEANSNYSTEPDDNGKEQGQYVITKNDVNGDVDWKSIADSMDDKLVMNQSLNNLLKY